MKILSQEQTLHFQRLLSILKEYGFGYDISATGAGKTIVSLKLAKKLNVPAVVIGPPTLKSNWLNEAKEEDIEVLFLSNSSMNKIGSLVNEKSMIIIDESHAFKNKSQRTNSLLKYTTSSSYNFKYVLFLSATPFDHPRQSGVFNSLTKGISKDLVMSRIMFEHKTKVKSFLCFVNQSEEELKMYYQGNSQIFMASNSEEFKEDNFNPSIFNSGLKKIHSSLISALLQVIGDFSRRSKLIICLKFKEHFEVVSEFLGKKNVLILNGDTSMNSRADIVSKFQKPSWEYRAILISASVGGVGIDLDDQEGIFPRIIIALPLFISEYIQLVGRVQRKNTRSDAEVLVLQPKRERSYFKRQLEVKGQVLKLFGRNLDFKKKWEHSKNCDARIFGMLIKKKFGKDLAGVILNMCCSCFHF